MKWVWLSSLRGSRTKKENAQAVEWIHNDNYLDIKSKIKFVV